MSEKIQEKLTPGLCLGTGGRATLILVGKGHRQQVPDHRPSWGAVIRLFGFGGKMMVLPIAYQSNPLLDDIYENEKV